MDNTADTTRDTTREAQLRATLLRIEAECVAAHAKIQELETRCAQMREAASTAAGITEAVLRRLIRHEKLADAVVAATIEFEGGKPS